LDKSGINEGEESSKNRGGVLGNITERLKRRRKETGLTSRFFSPFVGRSEWEEGGGAGPKRKITPEGVNPSKSRGEKRNEEAVD